MWCFHPLSYTIVIVINLCGNQDIASFLYFTKMLKILSKHSLFCMVNTFCFAAEYYFTRGNNYGILLFHMFMKQPRIAFTVLYGKHVLLCGRILFYARKKLWISVVSYVCETAANIYNSYNFQSYWLKSM